LARIGLGGPVGFFFASIGFSSAVLVARVWEFFSRPRCGLFCPSRSSVFELHHFDYGLVLTLVSMGFLAITQRQRVRWDAALIFGIGIGLCTDEAGMLLLKIPYNSPLSLLLLATVGAAFSVGTINAAIRDGILEFKVLDRADILTELSILLAMAGFLYLDRPLIISVEVAGAASWVCALDLIGAFGRKHLVRIWTG
jgi:hypothetical protein